MASRPTTKKEADKNPKFTWVKGKKDKRTGKRLPGHARKIRDEASRKRKAARRA